MRRLGFLAMSVALAAGAARAAPPVRPGDPLDQKPLSRIIEYDLGGERQTVQVDGRKMQVLEHPVDETLLVQRSPGGALLQGASEGISLGLVSNALDQDAYRRAAEAVAGAEGCRVTDMRTLDGRVSWEASYVCPGGARLKTDR